MDISSLGAADARVGAVASHVGGAPATSAPVRTRAGIGRGEEKRYLSLLFNPSINPLPPKGERGIYVGVQACIRTLERVVLRTPIRPDLRRPSA